MRATGLTTLLTLSVLIFGGCTQRQRAQPVNIGTTGDTTPTQLSFILDFQYKTPQGQVRPTYVSKMFLLDDILYSSGYPFGLMTTLMRNLDQEDPYPIWAESEHLIDFSPDPPLGGWRPDWYASGAMLRYGNYFITAGTDGASIISFQNSSAPQEVNRYPMPVSSGLRQVDPHYAWKGAVVPRPGIPKIIAFSQQDYIYTVNAGSLPQLPIVSAQPYTATGPVCCAEGAAVLGNYVYVAMRSALWIYPTTASGDLLQPIIFSDLKAVGVAATSQAIFVLQNTTQGVNPAGIYAFNASGQNIGYFPIYNVTAFAPTSDNAHLVVQTADAPDRIGVYRLNW